MKFEIHVAGKTRVVELTRDSDRWRISLDGQPLEADAVEVAPHTFSLLLNGQSHELRVTPAPEDKLKINIGFHEFIAEVVDPRAWSGRRHAHSELEGRQQVLAPMPGKVIRLLVNVGDTVEAGQGLLVVEAMKMQNEIRSPKTGTVEKLLAKEGQPVNAGETLCIVI